MLKKVLFPAIFVLMITLGADFCHGIIIPFYIYPTAQALQPISECTSDKSKSTHSGHIKS